MDELGELGYLRVQGEEIDAGVECLDPPAVPGHFSQLLDEVVLYVYLF